MKYWLNFDKPTGMSTLHRETCIFCKPLGQRFKGVNRLSDHGGWFKFSSKVEAYAFYLSNFPKIVWQPCKKCMKHIE
jgi:hypothetical protein